MGTWAGVADPAYGQDENATGDALVADTGTLIVVDPDAGSISGTHLYEFTNPSADQVFSDFFETVPVDAVDIVARVDGEEALVLRGTRSERTLEVRIAFPSVLEPGDRASAELSWLRSGLDGDPNELVHASSALVAIDGFAVGHGGGTASLTIDAPAGYEVTENSGLIAGEVDGRIVLRSAVAEPYRAHRVVLTASERMIRIQVDEIALDLTLATLSVSEGELLAQIRDLVPVLEAWLPIEIPGPIEVRHGWTGPDDAVRIEPAADTDPTVIVVSPQVDPAALARELAAEWISPIELEDPRIGSALAGFLGREAATRLGLEAPDQVAVDNPWLDPLSAALAELDDSEIAAMIGLLDGGTIAYEGTALVERTGSLDWRVVLDIVENLADTQAADLFGGVVEAAAQLDRRAATRLDYFDLVTQSDGWSLPPVVRVPMADWDFDEFDRVRPRVQQVIEARDELRIEAGEIELPLGSFARDLFEAADEDLDETAELLALQQEALEALAEARQLTTGDRGLLSRIGLAGVDTGAEYDEIVGAWNEGDFESVTDDAHTLIAKIDSAVARGTLRLVIPSVALVALFALVNWVVKRRRPVLEKELAQLEAE